MDYQEDIEKKANWANGIPRNGHHFTDGRFNTTAERFMRRTGTGLRRKVWNEKGGVGR